MRIDAMISADTMWRPVPGRIFTATFWVDPGKTPKGASMPSDSVLTFPPPTERRTYTLEVADAWAAVIDLSEWSAYMSFGPVGRGEGDSEPAGAWQTLL